MSKKIVRSNVTKPFGYRMLHIDAPIDGVFSLGDKVVVILESEYDALVEKATKYDGLCK